MCKRLFFLELWGKIFLKEVKYVEVIKNNFKLLALPTWGSFGNVINKNQISGKTMLKLLLLNFLDPNASGK